MTKPVFIASIKSGNHFEAIIIILSSSVIIIIPLKLAIKACRQKVNAV